jgi:hypothetical protein
VTRAWIGTAAIGAGLIHLALVLDAQLVVGALLAIVGVAEFGGGLLALFDVRFLVPRVAIVAALCPVVLWIAALLLGAPSLRPLPLAAASLLDLAIAALLALAMRRAPTRPRRPSVIAGALLGVLVVVAVTVPALLATRAGQSVLDPRFTENEHH